MERCIAMNVKKCWISTAIVLAVYVFGFCNAQVLAGVKNNYQARRTVDLSALTFHTTFSEAIDILRNSASLISSLFLFAILQSPMEAGLITPREMLFDSFARRRSFTEVYTFFWLYPNLSKVKKCLGL